MLPRQIGDLLVYKEQVANLRAQLHLLEEREKRRQQEDIGNRYSGAIFWSMCWMDLEDLRQQLGRYELELSSLQKRVSQSEELVSEMQHENSLLRAELDRKEVRSTSACIWSFWRWSYRSLIMKSAWLIRVFKVPASRKSILSPSWSKNFRVQYMVFFLILPDRVVELTREKQTLESNARAMQRTIEQYRFVRLCSCAFTQHRRWKKSEIRCII